MISRENNLLNGFGRAVFLVDIRVVLIMHIRLWLPL